MGIAASQWLMLSLLRYSNSWKMCRLLSFPTHKFFLLANFWSPATLFFVYPSDYLFAFRPISILLLRVHAQEKCLRPVPCLNPAFWGCHMPCCGLRVGLAVADRRSVCQYCDDYSCCWAVLLSVAFPTFLSAAPPLVFLPLEFKS